MEEYEIWKQDLRKGTWKQFADCTCKMVPLHSRKEVRWLAQPSSLLLLASGVQGSHWGIFRRVAEYRREAFKQRSCTVFKGGKGRCCSLEQKKNVLKGMWILIPTLLVVIGNTPELIHVISFKKCLSFKITFQVFLLSGTFGKNI